MVAAGSFPAEPLNFQQKRSLDPVNLNQPMSFSHGERKSFKQRGTGFEAPGIINTRILRILDDRKRLHFEHTKPKSEIIKSGFNVLIDSRKMAKSSCCRPGYEITPRPH